MYETKSKWFKKVLRATLCFLVVCGSLSAMSFVPNKEEETPQVPIETELCVYSAPLQVSPTPTPIPIEEDRQNPRQTLTHMQNCHPRTPKKSCWRVWPTARQETRALMVRLPWYR